MNSTRALRNDEAHQLWLASSFAGGVTDAPVTGGGSAPVSLLVADPVDE